MQNTVNGELLEVCPCSGSLARTGAVKLPVQADQCERIIIEIRDEDVTDRNATYNPNVYYKLLDFGRQTTEILDFRLRPHHFEKDVCEFIVLKNRYEKATGALIQDDLFITRFIRKTTGALQQHLRRTYPVSKLGRTH